MVQTKPIQDLVRATASELAERLTLLEVDFADILVIGKQNDTIIERLQEKWPNATLQHTGPDMSSAAILANLQKNATTTDETEFKLPFDPDSFNLVVSNLAVSFYPPAGFALECLRVLKNTGVLMVSAFGPGSFDQLEKACKHEEELQFTATFIDMHDFADLLYSTGDFINPVVDTDRKEFCYGDIQSLIDDFQNCGFAQLLADNPDFLNSDAVRTNLLEHYPGVQEPADKIQLDIEHYFAIAWKYVDDSTSKAVRFTVH